MIKLSALTDEALLPYIMASEETAFRELYERYNSLLYSYAYRKLKHKQEAQDVVQEVFIFLWNKRHDFELKTSLKGYLYKSVLNKVLDIFKHRKVEAAYAGQYIDIDTAQTDFLLRENEIAALIEKEIAAMPPRMREIYELKRKHYLSAKEIAEHLDLSEHTVNTQMKRALKLLRMRLGVIIYLLHILS